jgi:hypothetical protein
VHHQLKSELLGADDPVATVVSRSSTRLEGSLRSAISTIGTVGSDDDMLYAIDSKSTVNNHSAG